MPITDGHELISPHAYAEHGPPHDLWTRLRVESPVHYCEPEGFEPFWAITKHADICEISTQPERFVSEPGITVLTDSQRQALDTSAFAAMRVIIQMDPPEHRAVRKVASPVFTPLAIRALDEEMERSARELVDELAGKGGEGECDFATDVATAHPLRVLSHMLGVPREQEPDILRLTNQLFALDDPELQRKGDDRQQAIMELGLELYEMFDKIIQDRRAHPREDLASILANGTVDGEPLGMMETVGYYLIVFSAGHDTTKNALAGGMQAFLEHPDELHRLQAHPELVDRAVEEVVRWTSPVNYMKRTAVEDAAIGGQRISDGDCLVMFYGSANRDADEFEEPFRFRIDREKNRHLGFGIGEHFCLGANMARRSQRALWLELSRRLEWAESAGDPEQIHSSFVVGLKHLPMRYRIRPATL
jgi:cytochrome P450|tara:strand:- start:74 stop:1330 length:1257 start_codon:yes stop_codon:yes gene_type:complete